VDYAGPFGIIPFVGRGQRILKHYVALFTCLATKEIHLEIVEDYTTAGFLAAFRRFVSRRGLPAHMYSDNGTNFHGADRELRPVYRQCVRIQPYKPTWRTMACNGISSPRPRLNSEASGKPVSRVLSFICGELLVFARFPRTNLQRYCAK